MKVVTCICQVDGMSLRTGLSASLPWCRDTVDPLQRLFESRDGFEVSVCALRFEFLEQSEPVFGGAPHGVQASGPVHPAIHRASISLNLHSRSWIHSPRSLSGGHSPGQAMATENFTERECAGCGKVAVVRTSEGHDVAYCHEECLLRQSLRWQAIFTVLF